jgi:drug/metabolite transporter (DMT)-like permease
VKLKEWGAFILLALVWGTSFLWIKIGVQDNDIGPLMLVSFRLLFGLIGLLVVMAVTRNSFPRDWRVIGKFFVLSIFATALPFTLITWAETQINSGLAGILNGTVPLFTIIFAQAALSDEKITLPRLGGLLIGFAGVIVLMSGDLTNGLHSSFLGQLAMLAASASYAIGIIFTRKYLRNQVPVVQSTMNLLFADLLLWISTLIFERPLDFPSVPITWIALAWLGLLGSCIAYLLYFYLINNVGATRTSVVTYVMPIIAVILGIIFLNEVLDWRLAVGLALILGGIGVINLKRRAAPAAPSSQIVETESAAK